jgi:hypothetical protein
LGRHKKQVGLACSCFQETIEKQLIPTQKSRNKLNNTFTATIEISRQARVCDNEENNKKINVRRPGIEPTTFLF